MRRRGLGSLKCTDTTNGVLRGMNSDRARNTRWSRTEEIKLGRIMTVAIKLVMVLGIVI